jgi:hypothetical protein
VIRDRLRELHERDVAMVTIAKAIARFGGRSFVAVLVILALLYTSSFAAPPPISPQEYDFSESPRDVLQTALLDLASETYQYRIDSWYVAPNGSREPRLDVVATIDNAARKFSATRRYPNNQFQDQIVAERTYATILRGYEKKTYVEGEEPYDSEKGWDDRDGYELSQNAFNRVLLDADTRLNATVVANNQTTYVLRIQDDAAARKLGAPDNTVPDYTTGWEANLTITIDKRAKAVTGARFEAWNVAGERVESTYRIRRGLGVGVHRPIGLYPPGVELLYRIDLGVQAISSWVPLVATPEVAA